MLAVSLVNSFMVEWWFTSGKLTLNVGYLLHLLLICICQLKCHKKQEELTYSFGYSTFINGYYYAKNKDLEVVIITFSFVILIMILLNGIAEKLSYNVDCIFRLYIKNQNFSELTKVLT